MKILTQITESTSISSITAAANKLMDLNIPQDLSAFYEFLTPQWLAGYMGLKKLVEKDYRHEEDPTFISLTNA
jgi:hypothetical protein